VSEEEESRVPLRSHAEEKRRGGSWCQEMPLAQMKFQARNETKLISIKELPLISVQQAMRDSKRAPSREVGKIAGPNSKANEIVLDYSGKETRMIQSERALILTGVRLAGHDAAEGGSCFRMLS
jgi:hypothetical protein